MRFYVIGSCRVHGPLRHCGGYQPGLPGYTHTTKEAIQRIRIVRDGLKIPGAVAPYVFSRPRAPAVTLRLRKAFSDSDVLLVEVCSGKEVWIGGYWANLNYTKGAKADVKESEDLEDDIRWLLAAGKRLVVAQHVELPGIPERVRFAARLREVCEALRVPVFRPSMFVGADEMLDAHHYRPDVAHEVGCRLLEFMDNEA